MIQARNACLSFGDQKVFDNVSFSLQRSDRVGLIGRNGSGKTTLLKAIVDPSFLESGTIFTQNGTKVAYMPQEVTLLSERSVVDETISADELLWKTMQEAKALESTLESSSDPRIIERYAAIADQLNQLSPERSRARAKQMLAGLGFSQQQFDAPVSSLSVGWKMRIVLAKLLLQEADFYLFDEPTNHLDLKAKEWFLSFLKRASFGFMIICHEKYFLDELCSVILDIERGKITAYTGNYSRALQQKEQRRSLLHAAYTQQQKEIEQKKAIIAKFKAGTKAKMAQSMQKALDKMEIIEIPSEQKKVLFSFPPLQQSGKEVITIKGVSHRFGTKTLFKNISCTVPRGSKIAIVASNGVGKTTLLNLICGSIPVQDGIIQLGHQVRMAVFAQDQNKVLDLGKTIFDNVRLLCPTATDQNIRTFLGSFLFSGHDALKHVGVLSGGEKNRVGMVGVLLQNANLLLLDEPTNHLDIETKEILLQALKEYNGTILFVSHDRDFVNELATDILQLTPDGAHLYKGNYDSYVYQTQSQPSVQKIMDTPAKAQVAPKQQSTDVQKHIALTEKKITKLEQAIAQQQDLFAQFTYGTDQYTAAVTRLQQLQKELDQHVMLWESLIDQL